MNKAFVFCVLVTANGVARAEPSIQADGNVITMTGSDTVISDGGAKSVSLFGVVDKVDNLVVSLTQVSSKANNTESDVGKLKNDVTQMNNTILSALQSVRNDAGTMNMSINNRINAVNSTVADLIGRMQIQETFKSDTDKFNENVTSEFSKVYNAIDSLRPTTIKCDSYPSNSNATVFGQGVLAGSIRIITCKPDYYIGGVKQGGTQATAICTQNGKWSDEGNTPCMKETVETVTCCFTFDNKVIDVYADGKKLTVQGNLNNWPDVKTFTMQSDVKVLGVHGQDLERGCQSGFFSMTCSQPSRTGPWRVRTSAEFIDRFEAHTEKKNPNPSWYTKYPGQWATLGWTNFSFDPSFVSNNDDSAQWKGFFLNKVLTGNYDSCGGHKQLGSFCAGNNDEGPTDWWFRVYAAGV